MHIGVIGAVIIRDPVDDRARFLRAGAAIEKHETGVAGENRELAPYQLRVKTARSGEDAPPTRRPHHYSSNLPSRRASRACKYSRTGACSILSRLSRPHASLG